MQRLRITGNIKDVVETTGQRQGGPLKPAARRIDEQGGEAVGIQIDVPIRRYSRTWAIAPLISSLDMRTMATLSIALAARL